MISEFDSAELKEQDPDDKQDYCVRFEPECANYREPNTPYSTNARVRPKKATGLQYIATSGGRSGAEEPRWSETIGQTVKDGSVTWTAEALADTSLKRTVSTVTWSADTGLTIAGQVIEDTNAKAFISGGTLGQTYLVRAQATLSDGAKATGAFWLKITRPR